MASRWAAQRVPVAGDDGAEGGGVEVLEGGIGGGS